MRILLNLFLCFPLVLVSTDESTDISNNARARRYHGEFEKETPEQIQAKLNDSRPVLYPVTNTAPKNTTLSAKRRCLERRNEESTNCYNPCEKTCATRFQEEKECIEECKRGCICQEGYLRNDGNKCVPIEQCSLAKCPTNEINIKCGPACGEKTCENYDSTCQFCTRPCLDGCFCKNGLVRSQNGTCIPLKDCPPRVCNGPNEYFDECPRLCPPQECCYKQSTFGCDATVCCNPSCQCKYGFLRDDNGVCIPKDQCAPPPTSCGVNEVLSDCYNECAPTCKTRFRRDGAACKPYCKMGCTCIDGYFKHDNGTCVSKYECSPPKCKRKEVYETCGSACEETCFEYTMGLTEACSEQCVEGCFCKKGFVRNWGGSCIKPRNCPKPLKCGPNEIYSKCKQTCPSQTCSNLWSPQFCLKTTLCAEPGCNCKEGYLRNGTANDPCIHLSQCPLPRLEMPPMLPTFVSLPKPPTLPTTPIPPTPPTPTDWSDRKYSDEDSE